MANLCLFSTAQTFQSANFMTGRKTDMLLLSFTTTRIENSLKIGQNARNWVHNSITKKLSLAINVRTADNKAILAAFSDRQLVIPYTDFTLPINAVDLISP